MLHTKRMAPNRIAASRPRQRRAESSTKAAVSSTDGDQLPRLTVSANVHVTFRDTEHLGALCVVHAFECQGDRLPVCNRQAMDRPPQPLRFFLLCQTGFRVWSWVMHLDFPGEPEPLRSRACQIGDGA